jgi:hypothetical protein
MGREQNVLGGTAREKRGEQTCARQHSECGRTREMGVHSSVAHERGEYRQKLLLTGG